MSMTFERTTLVAAVSGLAVAFILDVLLRRKGGPAWPCLLYTSDAADDLVSV